MAYSSYGKKVYISIKDLPQYNSIGDGDKIIIWNEARDGAATVDFGDLLIDLDHTTFKSTINEVITLASDIQSFALTTKEEIEGIQNTIATLENTVNNELKSRIKTLEFIIAIILGSNSYWLSNAGLDILKKKFLLDGITPAAINEEDVNTEEGRNALKWFDGFIAAVQSYIIKLTSNVNANDILLQTRFRYKYNEVQDSSQGSDNINTPMNSNTKIETVSTDGETTTTTTTTISYGQKEESGN